MTGFLGGVDTLLTVTESLLEGPVLVVNNLFRTGVLPRCVSTKSTPSAVSVKAELSARVMYPFFIRYQVVNSK